MLCWGKIFLDPHVGVCNLEFVDLGACEFVLELGFVGAVATAVV